MPFHGVRLNGSRIAERRRTLALTQTELAERAGVGERTVIQAESGRPVSLRTWKLLAAALGMATRSLRVKAEA